MRDLPPRIRDAPSPWTRRLGQGDREFPTALLDLPDAPADVYVRGRLPDPARTIAIVGSRAATPYGRTFAHRLALDLGRLGFATISGLARGIDAAAHRGALEARQASVAVFPGGLGVIAPRHHVRLAHDLLHAGAWLSEHPDVMQPTRGLFVRRNRLIAALSAATVVVEAARRSGALITAAAAGHLGRPVLAVPGDVDRETSRGCHALLRSGAAVCEAAADVVDALGGDAGRGSASEARSAVERLQAALTAEPQTAEALARAAGTDVKETLTALLRLQWAGRARACAGGTWTLASGAA